MGGELRVYTGPMMAGKSTALINALNTYQNVVAFKPATDDRYDTEKIVTHDGTAITADVVTASRDGINQIHETVKQTAPDAIGIDEAQFFADSLADTVHDLTAHGHDVIVAGIDTDFRGEPFGPMPRLIAAADTVTYLTATCALCGKDAQYTQRLLEGSPAPYDAPLIEVGGAETYEARCEKHHVVPRPQSR